MIPVPPPPTELPTNVVAIVAQVPDRGSKPNGVVTLKEFSHALVQVAAQKDRPVPKAGSNDYRRFKNVAIGELLDDAWIRGQAAEMGIGVSTREASRVLAALKRQAFKDGREYRQFLRESRYTRRDVLDRVEIQLFAAKIRERVAAGIGSRAGQQKAFAKFVSEYRDRWKSRTVCAPGYVTSRCSNGPSAAGSSGS